MNRIITYLSLFLGVQLFIAAVVLWPRQQAAEGLAQSALLPLSTEAVTRIAISDADTKAAIPALTKALDDEYVYVRTRAAEALKRILK